MMAQVHLKGIIREIIGTQTQTMYDKTGKIVNSSTSLHLRFETSRGLKKIVFIGYLPSDLIGKDVDYFGEAVNNQAEGRKITQKFILYHPFRVFLAFMQDHSASAREEISQQELESLLIQEYS